jgi:transcriptional regulator with XRE-family HTH domain
MKEKGETLGERIRRIRGKTYQVEFGKQLGVGQGTVSALERNDKDRLPSAEIYFRLAMLATQANDQAFFLEAAGLSRETIVSAANKLVKEQIVQPKEGEIVSIQPIQQLKGEKQTRPAIPFPDALGAKPVFVRYFTVDEQSAGYGLCKGDILLIDNSESGAPDLIPFWDEMILVEHDLSAIFDPENKLSPPLPARVEYVAGWLVLKEHRVGAEIQSIYSAEVEPWVHALLRPGREFETYVHTERFYRHRQSLEHLGHHASGNVIIGRWQGESAGPLDPSEKWNKKPSEILERARAGVRLYPGCQILGRVVGWFRPPATKSKK